MTHRKTVRYNRLRVRMSDKKNTIGRFEIIEKIGEGPIGAVYKALDPVIRRTVAIKVIKLYTLEESATFAEVFEKIYRVVRTSTALNHPNICIIYDLSEEKKIPFITMEYVDGHDVEWLLQNKHQFKRGEVLNILQQTCDALDFAHRKNVIHQDLKSTNLILTSDLHLKITDFGIAGLDEIAAAQTKKLLSIPYYISPEQALGEKVNPASDLFSLGTIIYQMLSGQVPFPGTSAANVIMMIARDNPAVPKDLEKSGIKRDDWDSFFGIALAKVPSQRFRSAKEMFEALSAILPPDETRYYPYSFQGGESTTPDRMEKTFVNESPTVMIDTSQFAADSAPPEPQALEAQPASAFDLLDEAMPAGASSAPTMMISREELQTPPAAAATVMIEIPRMPDPIPPMPPPAPPLIPDDASAPTEMISLEELRGSAQKSAPPPPEQPSSAMPTMMIDSNPPAPPPPPPFKEEEPMVTMRPTPAAPKKSPAPPPPPEPEVTMRPMPQEKQERKPARQDTGIRHSVPTPPPSPPAPEPPSQAVSAAPPPLPPAATAQSKAAGGSLKALGILAVIVAVLVVVAAAAFFVIPNMTSKQDTPAPQPEPTPIKVEPKTEPEPKTGPVVEQPVLPVAGKLSVTSEPPGATVLVDDQDRGVTPLEVPELPFGKHVVKVSLKGYQEMQQEIDLTAESAEVHLPVALEKATVQMGTLVVDSDPTGAFIIVNNRSLGTTPKTLPNQRPGKLSVTLKKDGFRDYTETVRINAGKSTSVRGTLQEIPKQVVVEPVKPVKPPEPSVKTGDIVTLGPGVTPPKATKKQPAKYPDAARKQRMEGVVGLSILISETGSVIDVKITKSANAILDEAAVTAVKQWVYSPATKEGVKVRVWLPVSMSFQSGR